MAKAINVEGNDMEDQGDAIVTGPRLLSLARGVAGKRTSSFHTRLAKLDHDGDGVIDEYDLVKAVDELVEQQKMTLFFKRLAIGAIIMFALLVAALTGITYALLRLIQTTQIDNGNFVTVKGSSQPALSGSAVLTLRNVTFNAADAGILSQSSINSTALALSHLRYHATIPPSIISDACLFYNMGLSAFTIHDPAAKTLEPRAVTVEGLELKEIGGCPAAGAVGSNLSGISGVITLNGMQLTVLCNATACAAFNNQTQAYVNHNPLAVQGGLAAALALGEISAAGNGSALAGRKRSLLLNLEGGCAHERSSSSACCYICQDQVGWTVGPACACKQMQNLAQCATKLHPDSLCCGACKVGWFVDGSCGCAKNECFPADASVQVLGRGSVSMAQLGYGDRVLSVDRASGRQVFREVFLFGHREPAGVQRYVSIHTASGHRLRLSPQHYIPVCTSGCTTHDLAAGRLVTEARYGSEVKAGDVVLVAAGTQQQLAPSAVLEAWVTPAAGAYNPLVRGADLLVDGVVASPHSNWVFDSIAPASMRKHLPAVYEAMMAPIYALYCMVGAANAEWLAHGLGLAEAGASSSYGAGYVAVVGAMAALASVPAACAVGHLGRW